MSRSWHIKESGKDGGRVGFTWDHIDGRDEAELKWLEAQTDLVQTVRVSLTAVETRPRCQPLHDGVIINLRGLRESESEEGDELVSIRIWAERGRVISLSMRRLAGLDELRKEMEAGKYLDPGDLIAALAIRITHQLDPVVAALGDEVDDCEVSLSGEGAFELRRGIARARSQAINYRRFVVPQRQALESMSGLQMAWIEDDDRIHLREAADRFARMAEELEAVRERSALLHEQLTDLRAEKIDRRSLVIAIVAMIFLPLTFVTGLFGMNVDGIPYQHHPLSFWAVTGFSVIVGVVVTGYFVVTNWFKN